jgi:hypothetical protein
MASPRLARLPLVHGLSICPASRRARVNQLQVFPVEPAAKEEDGLGSADARDDAPHQNGEARLGDVRRAGPARR